jgi:nitrogen regulatory protein P-II 1
MNQQGIKDKPYNLVIQSHINKTLTINNKTMKKIEAIIRLSRFEAVKKALEEQDITFFSYWDVRGTGVAREGHLYRGTLYDTSIIERRILSIIVRDENMDKTIEAIINAAKTGEIGDGRIFVSDVANTYRIRTGESGPETLYEK